MVSALMHTFNNFNLKLPKALLVIATSVPITQSLSELLIDKHFAARLIFDVLI